MHPSDDDQGHSSGAAGVTPGGDEQSRSRANSVDTEPYSGLLVTEGGEVVHPGANSEFKRPSTRGSVEEMRRADEAAHGMLSQDPVVIGDESKLHGDVSPGRAASDAKNLEIDSEPFEGTLVTEDGKIVDGMEAKREQIEKEIDSEPFEGDFFTEDGEHVQTEAAAHEAREQEIDSKPYTGLLVTEDGTVVNQGKELPPSAIQSRASAQPAAAPSPQYPAPPKFDLEHEGNEPIDLGNEIDGALAEGKDGGRSRGNTIDEFGASSSGTQHDFLNAPEPEVRAAPSAARAAAGAPSNDLAQGEPGDFAAPGPKPGFFARMAARVSSLVDKVKSLVSKSDPPAQGAYVPPSSQPVTPRGNESAGRVEDPGSSSSSPGLSNSERDRLMVTTDGRERSNDVTEKAPPPLSPSERDRLMVTNDGRDWNAPSHHTTNEGDRQSAHAKAHQIAEQHQQESKDHARGPSLDK